VRRGGGGTPLNFGSAALSLSLLSDDIIYRSFTNVMIFNLRAISKVSATLQLIRTNKKVCEKAEG
jgi:hypothetical protein